jgi:hypothetical protein
VRQYAWFKVRAAKIHNRPHCKGLSLLYQWLLKRQRQTLHYVGPGPMHWPRAEQVAVTYQNARLEFRRLLSLPRGAVVLGKWRARIDARHRPDSVLHTNRLNPLPCPLG